MRKFIACLLCLVATGCRTTTPDQAILAIMLHDPPHPRLAVCLNVSDADPSAALVSALLENGRAVFPASDCSKRGWSVLTSSGKKAYFENYGLFTRTGLWSANLRVHSYSNPMHSDVWLYKLQLVDGLWVVESEHQVSMA